MGLVGQGYGDGSAAGEDVCKSRSSSWTVSAAVRNRRLGACVLVCDIPILPSPARPLRGEFWGNSLIGHLASNTRTARLSTSALFGMSLIGRLRRSDSSNGRVFVLYSVSALGIHVIGRTRHQSTLVSLYYSLKRHESSPNHGSLTALISPPFFEQVGKDKKV